MDLHKAIRSLHEEKKRLDQLIVSLEQMQASGTAGQHTRSRRGRRSMGAEERREVSERMRKYWAARRGAPAAMTTGAEPQAGEAARAAASSGSEPAF